MDDKVFLATAKTEEALTEEQLAAVLEHGWQAVPHSAETSPASLLLRQVHSEDEAASQFALLIQDKRLSDLSSIVSKPYLENPLQAPVFFEPGGPPPKPEDPPKSDSAAGKPDKPADEPEKKTAPQSDVFPAIPEYLWTSLTPDSQEELAKKLVEYVVNRPHTAAYGSSFDDAALFAHLDDEERSGLAKKILEQKHGMTVEQVKREGLVNEFQAERVNLMKGAVVTATEINAHLAKWRELSNKVLPLLMPSSVVAGVFVLGLFGLVIVGRISGWEMAVLVFVFSLMAVSPATLLLIGRPLKGLDEWSPSRQEKKAEEPAKEEPAADKGKPETKTNK
ncbi:hypothetical protein [Pseudarthrobacter sulfonivorans]|uniref:hypothetical protein n=1 Tax=Pseudarthrobacter sulfonivorans TaxID=121292 RepID=UPI0028628921|nr:hypothetical protein [Pseudarthrobacter sulfonivorans]MDR6416970.1 hypothetical protein [Pseudarthrobacter sulfonivorans]